MTVLVRKLGVAKIMRVGQLLGLLTVYFEARLLHDSSWDTAAPVIVILLLALLVVSEFERLGDFLSIRGLVWVAHTLRSAGLGWAATGLIALIVVAFIPDTAENTVGQSIFWASGAIALAVSTYAFTLGRTRIKVRNYKLGNTEAETTVRITALSDLHQGEFVSANHIRKAVEISNAQSPDIVLLLGDYVDHDGGLADELLAEITNLKAKHGVFAVLGNHDIGASESHRIVEGFEADQSINLLSNNSVVIEFEPSGNVFSLQITGIESPAEWWDAQTGRFAEQVLKYEISQTSADFKLVASHHPDIFELCAEYGADLVVAGHTHGGQLAVPFTGRWLNVGRLAAKYFLGRYDRAKTTLIITPGIGVGILPARLGVPPEVTLIELGID